VEKAGLKLAESKPNDKQSTLKKSSQSAVKDKNQNAPAIPVVSDAGDN